MREEDLSKGRTAEQGSAIQLQRQPIHGDPEGAFRSIGLVWTGLLERHFQIQLDHPIPAELALAMMVGFKLSRFAYDPNNADTRLDVHGYATMMTDLVESKGDERS